MAVSRSRRAVGVSELSQVLRQEGFDGPRGPTSDLLNGAGGGLRVVRVMAWISRRWSTPPSGKPARRQPGGELGGLHVEVAGGPTERAQDLGDLWVGDGAGSR
jgi:hypothetical protein